MLDLQNKLQCVLVSSIFQEVRKPEPGAEMHQSLFFKVFKKRVHWTCFHFNALTHSQGSGSICGQFLFTKMSFESKKLELELLLLIGR